MENKCKYIIELERKNKRFRLGILLLIILVILIFIIKIYWNKISIIFYNDNGVFSNEILWTAIGSIGSILALIGVVLTIKYTEYSRKKQNQYEFMKEKLLQEHYEFKKEVKDQLEILDPTKILTETFKSSNLAEYDKIIENLNEYNLKIKAIDYKIYWYYNRTIQNNYVELLNFMNELNMFIKFMTREITEYRDCLTDFYNSTNISMERLDKFNKKTFEIRNDIVEYRNNNWNIIVEKAKKMIEERERVIKGLLHN